LRRSRRGKNRINPRRAIHPSTPMALVLRTSRRAAAADATKKAGRPGAITVVESRPRQRRAEIVSKNSATKISTAMIW
jgi:hypothetical protein